MKRYIAVLELDDDEEIIDASVSYVYRSNGTNYLTTESVEFKEDSEEKVMEKYRKYILALRKCAIEHDNDETSFAHIVVSDLCRDTANLLEKLEQEPTFDKIRTEIIDEKDFAYADFERYKEEVLGVEPDELPDDDFRFGMERTIEIIDKYMNDKCDKGCDFCEHTNECMPSKE